MQEQLPSGNSVKTFHHEDTKSTKFFPLAFLRELRVFVVN